MGYAKKDVIDAIRQLQKKIEQLEERLKILEDK